jgi:predicted 2-oxoglutarate/Fe(II)-dependent dioxygenase YbiX
MRTQTEAAGPVYAPATHGVTPDHSFFSLDAQAGRPLVLALVGRLTLAQSRAALDALQAHAADFASLNADLTALIEIENKSAREFQAPVAPDVRRVLSRPDVFAGWGFAHEAPTLVALDGGGRIIAGPLAASDDAILRLVAAVARLPREIPFEDECPAPVLAIPNVLSRPLCRDLIAHFEASEPAFGGMASVDANGGYAHKIDGGKKHRFDLVLGPRDPFQGEVLAAILTRCLPEIKKAFQIDIAHTDRLLLARYDETGGYFRRHRDNAAPSVAFRQFALSINLNDNYEGGHLLFPEYNLRRYRPRAGSAAAFSCSLLHEAAAVTQGRRYCLLTFLHDAAAQARWLVAARRAS